MILADENISPEIIRFLRERKIPVVSVYEEYRALSDEEVIRLAQQTSAIVLTEDKDFGEWAFSHKLKGMSVILLRFAFKETDEIKVSLFQLLLEKENDLFGSFTTLTTRKVRIRKL